MLGAMWRPEEVCVDPREVIADLSPWLERHHGASFHFEVPVTEVEARSVTATSGRLEVGRTWVCSGDEMRVLFSELLARTGLIRCKLQMMRSQPSPLDASVRPMLAGGLTLRHHDAFRDCTGLDALREWLAREFPCF